MGRVLWAVYPYRPARHNPDTQLSPDQQVAIDALMKGIEQAADQSNRVVMVLTGAAGTGKTTIMKELAHRVEPMGFSVMYAAPTGKAASRLRETTGSDTSTLHSFLYGTPIELGICPRCNNLSEQMGMTPAALRREGFTSFECPVCQATFPFSAKDGIKIELQWGPSDKLMELGEKVLLIIDESSMVGPLIYDDVLSMVPKRWPILWVGDREQLKPVPSPKEKEKYPGRTWGPDFDNPTANLTQVHRQSAGNPIINLATRIRNRQNDRSPLEVDPQFINDPRLIIYSPAPFAAPAAWLTEERRNRRDATLITWTNVLRRKMNFLVRDMRGLTALSNKHRIRVVRGDRLAILRNHRSSGMMNGEVYIVNASRKGPTLNGHPTIWVQLLPKSAWYLVAADGFNPAISDFNDRSFRDVFEAYLTSYYRTVEIIEKAMDRGVEPDIDPGLHDLMRKIQLAMDKDADCASTAAGKPIAEAADIMAGCDQQLALVDRMAEKYGVLPPSYPLFADYGECLTAHKAQGSQFKNVGVILDSGFDSRWVRDVEETRRWLYTAITRASQNLVIWKL